MRSLSWKSGLAAGLVTLTLAAGLGTALADTDGGAGLVRGLTVWTPSSTGYPNTHVAVRIGSEGFYSGGAFCSGIDELSEAQIDLLARALAEGLMVNPWYEAGYTDSGGFTYNCLTAFHLYGP